MYIFKWIESNTYIVYIATLGELIYQSRIEYNRRCGTRGRWGIHVMKKKFMVEEMKQAEVTHAYNNGMHQHQASGCHVCVATIHTTFS